MWIELKAVNTLVMEVPGGMVIRYDTSMGTALVFVPCSGANLDVFLEDNRKDISG